MKLSESAPKTPSFEGGKIKTPNDFSGRAAVVGDALKNLLIWFFTSYLFPIIQIILCSLMGTQTNNNDDLYGVLFVATSSFLTSIFFITGFWSKPNRVIVKIIFVLVYLTSLCLFLICLLQSKTSISFLDESICRQGVRLAVGLSIIVGFFANYDESELVPKGIANKATKTNNSIINGKRIKL